MSHELSVKQSSWAGCGRLAVLQALTVKQAVESDRERAVRADCERTAASQELTVKQVVWADRARVAVLQGVALSKPCTLSLGDPCALTVSEPQRHKS